MDTSFFIKFKLAFFIYERNLVLHQCIHGFLLQLQISNCFQNLQNFPQLQDLQLLAKIPNVQLDHFKLYPNFISLIIIRKNKFYLQAWPVSPSAVDLKTDAISGYPSISAF